MTLGDIIKEYRHVQKISMDEFSKSSGLSKAYISILERNLNPVNNKAPTPSLETIKSVSEAIGSDFNDIIALLDGSQKVSLAHIIDESLARSLTYPIIGEVAAGFGSEAIEEETGDYEQIPVEWLRGRKQDEFFVLRVKGDSMYPNYMDGDRVLVLRTPTVESGTIAVVLYDGQSATLKKVNYMQGEDWMELEPLNREYAPKRIEAADLEQCRVLGEVKRLIRVISE